MLVIPKFTFSQTEKEEDIAKRLANARGELEHSKKEGFWDMVLVNNNLEESYTNLRDWVLNSSNKP